MPGARITAGDYLGAHASYQALIERRVEFAALTATHQVGRRGKSAIRQSIQGAGLGRLGNAIDSNSDLSTGRGVHRRADGFSASSAVFVRSNSERTLGTLAAYTQGAKIRPVRGRWLWFATPEIQRLAGAGAKRERVTPGNWEKLGLDKKIGPLVVVKSINGRPLLAVKNVGVSALGVPGKARSLTKKGRARKGQIARSFLVAFVSIPATSRSARLDPVAIMRNANKEIGILYQKALLAT